MSLFQGIGTLERTDLFSLHNVIQNTLISNPKDIVIGYLRDFFSQDTTYHYVSDQWGFPFIPDHTNLPYDAGIDDDLTSRVYIAAAFRSDVIFYPSILIKTGSVRYTPISFNRNKETIQYQPTKVVDGYGNETVITTPKNFLLAGAWEGQLQVEIWAKDIKANDDLTRLAMLFFSDLWHDELVNHGGILVKGTSASAPTQIDDGNEKIHKSIVTVDIRSEWRRSIPIENTVDIINICVELGNLEAKPYNTAPNISINTSLELVEEMQNL